MKSATLVEHVLAAVLCGGVLLFLASSWGTIAYPYPVDYGEGPLLDNILRLSQGQPLYQNNLEEPPYRVCTYPPLYLLVQLPLAKMFGPALWYGRLVSFLGIVAAGLFLSLTLFSLTGDRAASLFAGSLFVTHPYVALWAPVFRVDSLALGLSWAALYLLVRHRASPHATWASILLLLLSISAKQSYLVAAPLAAFLWIASVRSFRRALLFAASLATAAAALFFLLDFLTDGGLLLHTVRANMNAYQPGEALGHLKSMALLQPVSLLLILFFLLRLPALPRGSALLPLACLLGALPSALAIGKVGSNINYFLEFAAASSLVTGALLAWRKPRRIALTGEGTRLFALLLPALILQVALSGYYVHREFRLRVGQDPEISRLAELVKAAPGPVLMDNHIGLLPLSGRPLHFQPFEMTALARDGLWDQSPLLEEIEQREFDLILRTRPFPSLRWTSEMLRATEGAYRVTGLLPDPGGGVIEILRPDR